MPEDHLEMISIYNYPVIVAGIEYLVLVNINDDETSELNMGYVSINEFQRDYSNSNR